MNQECEMRVGDCIEFLKSLKKGTVDYIFTVPLDLVCDPMMGSGSTAIAATTLGRRFIGNDIDKKVVKLAKYRMKRKGFFK
jgi:site-specific DNA-methyltransferase (adenine-specific)